MRAFLVGCALCASPLLAMAAASSANIVSLQGNGDVKAVDKPDWQKASIKQPLFHGDFVRTGDLSQMALLFTDNTQLRLNQNSQLQIKSAGDAQGGQTAVKLNAGRAWSQIKPQTGGGGGGARVSMETPSATMSIRGTDWEVEVAPDGTTQLVVLSGTVEIGNAQGQLAVGANEAALVVPGQAPRRLVLANPRERVQWVTAYRSEPWRYLQAEGPNAAAFAALLKGQRWEEARALTTGQSAWQAALAISSGEPGQARKLLEGEGRDWLADLLLADLRIIEGRPAEAAALFRHAAGQARSGEQEALALARLTNVLLMQDQGGEAATVLAQARAKGLGGTELDLAAGWLARFNGAAPQATAAYDEARQRTPEDARGWLGAGAVASEREDVAPARRLLDEAIRRDGEEATAFGEMGTLEALANRFEAAEAAFDKALALRPDDYVALTGRGVMRLKQGLPDAALEDLLKAGLMEPRYARARLYTGIAYYQLGRSSRALEEFALASRLDAKDPLPHLFASMVHTDQFEAADAVASAREALAKMPNLKSLNQVANNQKGAANVGTSLAFWNLRDWARAYAQDGEYPFWGGSHLFLADLYDGKYAKNSELFQGFGVDPTVFGASNRFQSLIHRPGHYQTLTLVAGQDKSVREYTPRVTLNGYTNSLTPLAYFLEVDEQNGRQRSNADFSYKDRTGSITAALGWMPAHDLRLFAYYDLNDTDSRFNGRDVRNLRFTSPTSNLSVGGSYFVSPTFMLQGRLARSRIEGQQLWGYAAPLDGLFQDHEISREAQWGLRYRHEQQFELVAGAERARSPENSLLTITPQAAPAIYSDGANLTEKTDLAYVSGKYFFSPGAFAQMDLWWTDYLKLNQGTLQEFGAVTPISRRYEVNRVSPRLGLTLTPWAGHRLRYAYQDWVRPSSSGTLGPVATAGVALDETLLRFGGRQKRHVLKWEAELSPRLYSEVSLDSQRVQNLGTYDLSLAENFASLARLRQKSLTDVADFYAGSASSELSSANLASRSKVDRLAWANNAILTDRLSVSATYAYTQSRLSLDGDSTHYYLPRHSLRLGTAWVSPSRIRLSADLLWRSTGFSLVDITAPRGDYWSGALSAYWESPDKRYAFSAFAKELFSPHDSTFYGVAANLRF
ncbi:FecR domain-containing protein [Azospira sp. I13]|uniref:FecR domain-containing protein n=1 Tax=Azospira sp. I13 TaxID=1765050 RepID=UPI000D5A16FB|nr:FecR domain-containing protein [Azospira sp. I13]